MIGEIDIQINAKRPNWPLDDFAAFVGAPSSPRIVGVPKRLGEWRLMVVRVCATYPDNSAHVVECVDVGGVWVATLPAPMTTGRAANGFEVLADGVDERGNPVEGYVLGRGSLTVYDRDATVTVGGMTYYLHLLDVVPAKPNRGDVCVVKGRLALFDGVAWTPFADLAPVEAHVKDLGNPHKVTAVQVGALANKGAVTIGAADGVGASLTLADGPKGAASLVVGARDVMDELTANATAIVALEETVGAANAILEEVV